MATVSRLALVVEDDLATAYLLERVLARRGYEVVRATDADEAWARLDDHRGWPIDLVMVDHGLAGNGALRLCQRIKAAGKKDTRVVLIGGSGDEVSRARALAAGARSVIVKPFAIGELEACLD